MAKRELIEKEWLLKQPMDNANYPSKVKMKVVAIKFSDGTYYAGCNKNPAQTLLGAQLYKSKKIAENIINKSINFPKYHSNPVQIVDVEINEVE